MARCCSSRRTPIRRAARTTRKSSKNWMRASGGFSRRCRARGLAEKTLVVFVSDNGGEWLSRNAPFFHRKDTVWEGGIRVPAIFRWTSALPAGRTLSRWASRWISPRRSSRSPAVRSAEPSSRASICCRSFAEPRRQSSGRSSGALARRQVSRAPCGAATGSSSLDGSKQLLFDVSRDPGERRRSRRAASGSRAGSKGMIDAWEKDVDAKRQPKSGSGAALTAQAPWHSLVAGGGDRAC